MEKKFLNLSEIKDRTIFDEVSAYLNDLINEATNIGALSIQNPDNEYAREIGRISILCADYEDNVLNLFPVVRQKNALQKAIDDIMYSRNLKQKELADIAGMNESVFSSILSGKKKITIGIAKKLYSKLNIPADVILANA